MNDTIEQLYQLIANEASAAAPADWRSIRIDAEIDDDNGQATYDYEDQAGYSSWFEPPVLVQYKIYQSFQAIRAQMGAAGSSWRSAKFSLNNLGEFKVSYDYD
ncbi:immunity protein YezG family protein [Pseudoxanthomonas sp.]|uniref:immunity protein YezG family protein n=1 Tax=Pseudoxanthomonas sp. TaxID=1871049 RepID=UPI0035B24F92